MKKGELKRQEILHTAESFFCHYGYESTSVQDILDELHTSKGSFYHHFISKEAVLEEICRNRAAASSGPVFDRASRETDSLKRLNILFSGMIPFSGEKLPFLLMLLPVFSLPEGMHIRSCYSDELSELYSSAVTATLGQGTESGIFSCTDSSFYARISLLLVNRCWLDICELILANEKAGIKTDPSDLLSITGHFRTVLERLLSAPFGSIVLMELPDLQNISEQIHLHWKNGL